MRYAVALHNSRKHHILKRRRASGLISGAVLVLAAIFILLFVDISQLDLKQFWFGFLSSLARNAIAYCLAAVLAVALGLFITSTQKIENLLLPIFDVLQSFPSFVLFPLMAVALSQSHELVIIVVLTINMLWPLLFSVIGGIKNRRQDLEEAATVFGATGWKRFHNFTYPELLPAILTGSIVAWGEGWDLTIGAELLVQINYGIGKYLGNLGDTHQEALLAFGIVALMLLLFILNKIIWLPLLHKATKYQTEA